MTITTSVNKIIATGDAIQVDFPYDFIVLAESHMNVYLDGVLEDTANWSMTGLGVQAGGVVTMASAPADGVKVTLLRTVPNTQLTDYSAYGSFPAETHERALDLRVMEAQQIQEGMDRALKAPIDDDGAFDYSLPTPVANRSWKINGTNDAIILTDGDPDQAQSDAAAQVVLAAAQVTLAVAAKDASVVAQGLSEDARDASVVAKDASVAAKDLSELWADSVGQEPGGVGTKSSKEWAADSETAAASSVQKTSDTGSALIPTGTTAQRDAVPTYGAQRANSTLNQQEWWNGVAWVPMGADVPFVANDSRVKTATNAGGTAPIYSVRAWANFNGIGTPAIRASGNISSISDNATGDYSANFATAMPDNFSAVVVSCGNATGSVAGILINSISTNSVRFETGVASTPVDYTNVCIAVIR